MLKHGSSSLCHWNWFLFIFVSICLSNAAELDEYGRTALAKNITAILDRLVNKSTYDRRLRPNYGGEPVEVGITIFVSSISAVSEVEMDYTLDIYLRQMWSDRRLAFNASIENITIDVEYMKSIWVPDTFFPNEKKSLAHTATTHNSFLRITKAGNVTTSQRLTVTAACSMDLLLFPLDSQECTLEIESYGYSTRDIKYVWWDGQNSVSKEEQFALPQFQVKEHKIAEKEIELTTGSYSRLVCRFLFIRSIGFYMIQIYLPSSLIVIISWVSFWLSRDATPARVALGVTTVLTMTTLMTTTNAAMPKVSYIKSIDVYLGTCFLMVFASLIEYAAVGYLNKRLKMRREVQARGQDQLVPPPALPPTPLDAQLGMMSEKERRPSAAKYHPTGLTSRTPLLPSNTVSPTQTGYGSVQAAPPPSYGLCQCSDPPFPQFPYQRRRDSKPTGAPRPSFDWSECDCDSRTALSPVSSYNINQRRQTIAFPPEPTQTAARIQTSNPKQYPKSGSRPKRRRVNGKNPSSIDKYSRVIFPLAFATFNAIYWLVYSHISQQAL